MHQVWRLSKAKYAATAFSGQGAILHAGRWHLRGHPVVYTASSPALALLETLVHVERAVLLTMAFVAIPAYIPRDHLEVVDVAALPEQWDAWPHPLATQQMGHHWLHEQRSVALAVPSAVVPHERNILLNPQHPNFSDIEIGDPEPFPIDERLTW